MKYYCGKWLLLLSWLFCKLVAGGVHIILGFDNLWQFIEREISQPGFLIDFKAALDFKRNDIRQ